ncbi:sodium/hydrogen exchanger [Elysia marginata]|uniref:Sodium/hydrogen exchanger n=1 Tax=Elysia marginata TaxID=1093978 RepID=A0AAV4HIR5_9GAST|nr:sodium/hydrogen exchanger [Elysia marginata]
MMLSWLVNQRRLIRLSAIDQFIMSYGGLRGGIAFCLALLLNAEHIPERQMFVTTTTVIVFFTVFVQGITIKPVVNALKVERAEEIDTSMNEMIHKRFIDHLMAGVEDIIGKSGHNSIFQRFDYYNDKFLKPWLLREKQRSRETKILRTYTRLNMQDAKTVAKAFPVSIPREFSFSSLNALSGSPSAMNTQNMGRRATIAVPNNRDVETVVNVGSNEPTFQKSMNDESSVLHDALLEPRPGYLNERRHTMAEIHPYVPANLEQLRNLMGSNNNNNTINNNNISGTAGLVSGFSSGGDAGSTRSNADESPVLSGSRPSSVPSLRRLNKNVSFSSSHGRLTKKLSDVAELHTDGPQEVSFMPEDDRERREVTFTVGQPAPHKKSLDKDVMKGKTVMESLVPRQTPIESSQPGARQTPIESSQPIASSQPGARQTPIESSQPGARLCSSHFPPLDPLATGKTNLSCDLNTDACVSTTESSPPDHSVSTTESSPPDHSVSTTESSSPGHSVSTTESSPPVPSALSQSLPDDEEPLHYEAPSWADNPAYHRLTQSGSPYHSPNTTITAAPQEDPPRLVFDIFPSSHSKSDETESSKFENENLSFIPPPPWCCMTNQSLGEEEAQPLPSQALAGCNTGDKAACMLVSAHDLVPPTHHPCLQPAGPSTASLSSSHKHSQASSPLHFQCMEKPETISSAAIEAQVIGIQADYHHGMKDRVSQWLASTHATTPHEEESVERVRILASLRDKQEKWAREHETDEGTDADVESDYEEALDTRL